MVKYDIKGDVCKSGRWMGRLQPISIQHSVYRCREWIDLSAGKILWPVNREVHGGRPSERRGNKVVEEGRIDNPICYIREYFGWIDSCALPKRKTLRSKDRLVYIWGQPLDSIKIIYGNDGTAEDKKEGINIESMNDIIEI